MRDVRARELFCERQQRVRLSGLDSPVFVSVFSASLALSCVVFGVFFFRCCCCRRCCRCFLCCFLCYFACVRWTYLLCESCDSEWKKRGGKKKRSEWALREGGGGESSCAMADSDDYEDDFEEFEEEEQAKPEVRGGLTGARVYDLFC